MSAARRALAALAALSAAAPAAAFVRSTTHIDPGPDPTQGACLWWPSKQVTFKVNASGYQGNCGAAAASALIHASVHAWEAPSCTDFRYLDGGDIGDIADGNDGENRILVRKGSCSDSRIAPAGDACHGTAGACAAKFNCWEHGGGADLTIALTTATFRVADGQIVDADMELFSWGGLDPNTLLPTNNPGQDGWYFTCGTPPSTTSACQRFGDTGCLFIDLGHTVTHEAGHMLGLDHPCVYGNLPSSTCVHGAIMEATANPGDVGRTLTQDDANGVCAIYPAGKAVDKATGCFGQPDSSSGGGCATASAGELALLALVPLALRRRRTSTPR